MTFGLIPKTVSRSHFSVGKDKIAVVSDRKRQWKQMNSHVVTEALSLKNDGLGGK